MRRQRTRNLTGTEGTKYGNTEFCVLADLFIGSRRAKGSAVQTVKHYEQSIRKLKTFLAFLTEGKDYYTAVTKEAATEHGGQVPCSALNRQDIDEQLRSFLLNVEHVNPQTANTYFRDYRAIVYYAIEQGYAEPRNITIRNIETEIRDVYSESELMKLLKPPKKECSFPEYRNWVVINYLLATGNRVDTIVNLRVADIDFEENMIAINTQKNKKKTRIPMEAEHLAKILRKYIGNWLTDGNGRLVSEYLFPSSYLENEGPMSRVSMGRAIANYNRSRGVNKTSIHLFRHTFVKNWILNGGDLHSLQRILGHSTLDMVVHYANLYDTDLRDKVKAYSALSKFKQPIISHTPRNKRQ